MRERSRYRHDDDVIVAVEGPSAAGKTTWCRRLGVPYVEEYAATGNEPDGSDVDAQAAFWVTVNADRWRSAERLEARIPIAVCDSDPLKLHYSWCLARVGAASWGRFEQELHYVRRAFARGDLGFVDVVLVTIPDMKTLRNHKESDPSRSRKSFELHSRLGKPLHDWYAVIDLLDPGRVLWGLPPDGLDALRIQPRPDRNDPALFDDFIARLPGK